MIEAIWIAFGEQLLGALGITLVGTLVGAPVMKFYLREMKFALLARICAWAFLRIMLVFIVFYDAYAFSIHDTTGKVNGLASLVAYCAIGYVISHDLKKEGVIRSFPGIGARVMIALLVVLWIVVGIAFLTGAFRH